ncbi:MAG: stage II sporulation protein M [Halanaerobiaceae bacterium]
MWRQIYNLYLKKKTAIFIFLIFIFLLGVLFGVLALYRLEAGTRNSLFQIISGFMQGISDLKVEHSVLIKETIGVYVGSLFLIWLLGISVIAMPLIPVIILVKGFGLGFTAAFLIHYFDFSGFLLLVFTVLPQNIFDVPVYILAGITGISFSIRIINYFRGRGYLYLIDFFDYTLKMMLLTVFLLFSILLEVFVSPFVFEKIIKYF